MPLLRPWAMRTHRAHAKIARSMISGRTFALIHTHWTRIQADRQTQKKHSRTAEPVAVRGAAIVRPATRDANGARAGVRADGWRARATHGARAAGARRARRSTVRAACSDRGERWIYESEIKKHSTNRTKRTEAGGEWRARARSGGTRCACACTEMRG